MLISYVKNTYLSTCSPIRGSEQACITIVFYTTIKDREKKPFNMCVVRIFDVVGLIWTGKKYAIEFWVSWSFG